MNELRERIAKRFALFKYGGTEAELYPHWIRAGEIEADELLSCLCEPVEGIENPMGKNNSGTQESIYFEKCRQAVLEILK